MANTTIYTIDSTDGTTTLVLQPRTFNGVGSSIRSTDLTLYGNGAPDWGERFNQNFYRLTEHFACVQSAANVPSTEDDLGEPGTGINNPILGQLWYNKTNDRLFLYNGANWNEVPLLSDVVTLIGGIQISDVSGLQTALDDKVDRSGDTMTGNLNISLSDPALFITESDQPAGSQSWMFRSNGGSLFIQALSGTTTGGGGGHAFKFVRSSNQIISFDALNSGNTWTTANNSTKRTTYSNGGSLYLDHDPTSNLEAATKQYVDAATSSGGFVAVTGDTMSGKLTITSSAANYASMPLVLNGYGSGPTSISAGVYQGGIFSAHLNNTNTNTGGMLMTVGDTDNDQYALKIENVNAGSGLPALRRVFAMKATTGDTTWFPGAQVVLGKNPVNGLEAATKQYVDSVTSGAGYTFVESGEFAVNSTVIWSHGLGVQPKSASAILRCKVANYGYSVGDEFEIGYDAVTGIAGGVYTTSTQVGYRYVPSHAVAIVAHKTTATFLIMLVGDPNWRLIFRVGY